MDTLRGFLSQYHVLVSGLLGAVVSAAIMRVWARSAAKATLHRDASGHPILTYSKGGRCFLVVFALLCIGFGSLPLYALQWPGQVFIKFLLGVAFVLMGIYMLFEARYCRLVLRDDGVEGTGFTNRTRFIPWSSLLEVRDHSSLQMLRLVGQHDGRRIHLYAPYTLVGMSKLVDALNQRGHALPEQQPYLFSTRTYAFTKLATSHEELNLKVGERPLWFSPFMLSVWPLLNEQGQMRPAAVLTLINKNGHAGYRMNISQPGATPHGAVTDLLALLKGATISGPSNADPEYIQAVSEDIAALLAAPENWPH